MESAVPVSHFYVSQRHRLHYLDWGNPDAPPLILLHGVRDHAANWDWLAERLRTDWHIIAPDLRGHGDSQASIDGTYRIEGYVYDLAELIRHLAPAPVRVVAHSLGGRIALRTAGIFPDSMQRLAVIEGLGPPPDILATQANTPAAIRMRDWATAYRDAAGRPPRRYRSLDEAAARMQEQNPRLPPDKIRHLTLRGMRQTDDGSFVWKFDPLLRVPPPFDMTLADIEQIWANIACPTLLIHGADSFLPDPHSSGRERQFPRARFVTVEGAGHWVHHDQLDTVVALLRGFLP